MAGIICNGCCQKRLLKTTQQWSEPPTPANRDASFRFLPDYYLDLKRTNGLERAKKLGVADVSHFVRCISRCTNGYDEEAVQTVPIS